MYCVSRLSSDSSVQSVQLEDLRLRDLFVHVLNTLSLLECVGADVLVCKKALETWDQFGEEHKVTHHCHDESLRPVCAHTHKHTF